MGSLSGAWVAHFLAALAPFRFMTLVLLRSFHGFFKISFKMLEFINLIKDLLTFGSDTRVCPLQPSTIKERLSHLHRGPEGQLSVMIYQWQA